MKETQYDTNRCKVGNIYCVLGLEESVLLKWLYYLRQSTDSIPSLWNYQWYFLTELEQINLKFVWKHKSPWIAKTVLRKNRAGGLTSLTSHNPTVIKSHSNQNSTAMAQK